MSFIHKIKHHLASRLILAGLSLILLSSCNSGNPNNSGVVYNQFNYSTTPVYSSLITGVRGVSYSSNVYITGLFYESATSLSQGMLYTGPVTGGGTWQVFNFPGSVSTSFYGPDNNGYESVIVAGSYTESTNPTLQKGLVYIGSPTTSENATWIALDMSSMITRPNESAIFTFAHSTMGGLVVGNFDTNIQTGRAFVYNIHSNSYTELIQPQAPSITAYGIWYNQGTSYTIAGGYSDAANESGISIAYLADWDSTTNTASNWESYNFNNQPDFLTHFEGITTDGHGGYNLAVDYTDSLGVHAGIGHVTRNSNGTFSAATWAPVQYPGSVITSANTVYQNYIMGVYTLANTAAINSYTAAVPGF